MRISLPFILDMRHPERADLVVTLVREREGEAPLSVTLLDDTSSGLTS